MTPTQLSDVLNRQVEELCRFLLPQGKRVGKEWVAGDAFGNPGRSLKVVLEGGKIGIWSDFATGESGGDLIDLWRLHFGVTLYEAMKQCAAHVGIVMDGWESRPQRDYPRPERPRNARKPKEGGNVFVYLTEARKLAPETLETFQIGEQDDQWILFPYKRDGQLINTKYLHLERDEKGKKRCRQETGAEPSLFGWHALEAQFPATRYVALVEGEVDAMSLHQCGIPALSVPNGGGGGKKQDWIESDYDYLNRFDTIFLCLDNDDAGKEAEREIMQRLGSERCKVVTLPYKDANECLVKGIYQFNDYFLRARTFDPAELKPADSFMDSVLDKFYPKPGSPVGMKTPWAKLSEALTFNKSELIIWTGYSGSGKSQVLGQVAIHGIQQNERFAICSLEMPSRITLWRMVRQITGQERPLPQDVKQAMMWLKDKLWMIDVVGKMKTERILEVFRYAAKRYNIHHFVLDSLTKCNIREDDYDGQKEFIDALCDFNHQYEATTHLVVHQRKPDNDQRRPDKFGVRGASAITDEASTVMSVYRVPEQDDEPKPKRKGAAPKDESYCPHSTILSIVKNRETGIEGKFGLYFDPQSLQFHEQPQPSISYLVEANDDGTF